MTEILFYHLTESKLEDALPPLLEKSLERGWKVAVQTVGEERRDFLDTHLWTFRDDSFLPHATDTSPVPQNQPILLTASDGNANAASVRFLVDGAEPRQWRLMNASSSCSTDTMPTKPKLRETTGKG